MRCKKSAVPALAAALNDSCFLASPVSKYIRRSYKRRDGLLYAKAEKVCSTILEGRKRRRFRLDVDLVGRLVRPARSQKLVFGVDAQKQELDGPLAAQVSCNTRKWTV